jgi:hypothetical protein
VLTISVALSLLAGHNNGVAVEATFSIAAIDTDTQQIGAAGASCVPNSSIYETLFQCAPKPNLQFPALPFTRSEKPCF